MSFLRTSVPWILGSLAVSLARPPGLPPGGAPARSEAPAAAVKPDSLPGLIAEALRNHPGLKAARLEAQASREDVRGAAALPPPRLGVEFYQAPLAAFPNPVKDQMEIDYFVEQAFPFPGKRGALAAPARKRAEAAAARIPSLERQAIRAVQEAFYEVHRLDALRRINADAQSLVRRFLEVARRQYESGLGSQADILKAHTELAALSHKAVGLLESREAAVGSLNAMLDRKADSAFAVPEHLRAVPASLPFDRVLALAQANHPELAAMDAEIRVMEAEAAAFRRELWPDLMLRGAYKDMREPPLHGGEPEDAWAVMVSMDLPLAFWSAPRYRAGYRSASVRAEQARLERKAAANRVAAEVRAALASLRASAEGLDLARIALLPHAEQALQSVQSAYAAGRSGFMELMDAWRMALEAREEEAEAVVKVARSRAAVEAAAGMEFAALEREAGKPAPAGMDGGRP